MERTVKYTAPTCGRCKRPVARLTHHLDAVAGEIVFVAECHGDREETRVPVSVLAGGARLIGDVAFREQHEVDVTC